MTCTAVFGSGARIDGSTCTPTQGVTRRSRSTGTSKTKSCSTMAEWSAVEGQKDFLIGINRAIDFPGRHQVDRPMSGSASLCPWSRATAAIKGGLYLGRVTPERSKSGARPMAKETKRDQEDRHNP